MVVALAQDFHLQVLEHGRHRQVLVDLGNQMQFKK